MLKIYLAGPIAGCTDSECMDWRSYAKALLPDHQFLDPLRRDYRGQEMNPNVVREIILMDTQDIEAADVMLVNFHRPSVGTSMEILLAHQMNKPVIVHMELAPHIGFSPWLMHFATRLFYDWEEVAEWIDRYHALRP